MDENVKEIARLQARTCLQNLRQHNFEADWFETKEEAADWIHSSIEKGSVIGVGGSKTLDQMHLVEWLTNNPDYHFLDRYHTDDKEKIFHEVFSADYFLMSSNAVTMDGCLYNVDGNGNRVAALIYGPKKVYVICGVNKIVKNLEEAIARVQQIAAPANNVRLKKDNPCTKIGTCVQCLKDTSICNEFVVTRRSGTKGRIHVILINETLGY